MKSTHLIFLAACFTQAHAINLPTQTITPYECKTCDKLSHEDLNSSWLTNDQALSDNTIHQQMSRKYQITATPKQLQNGITIHAQKPGAIIYISSANPAITASPNFYLKTNQGVRLSLKDASSLFSKDEALNDTPFAGQLVALQLKPELGAGKFILSSDKLNENEGPFVIHVYDKFSPTYLSVETDKAHYRYGDKLNLKIRLSDEDASYLIDNIDASLVSPAGEITPISLEQMEEDNLYQAQVDLTSDKNVLGENWYIAVETSTMRDDIEIVRHAHTAFSYAIPSATIREIKADDDPLSFTAKIEVATGSRYALEAVLFGTDSEGKLHPITAVQSASWLAPGKHPINFSFDSELKTDYKAPYYLGYLHLIDYGQLKPVYEYNTPIELTTLG